MLSGLLVFWGLLLAYLLGPLAAFFFLNRLLGDKRSSSARALAASFGLGTLLFSWGLQGLVAAFPGKPYSFHLWTLSGVALLLLAASERKGADCAEEMWRGSIRLINASRNAFWNWRESWLTMPLFALSAALFGTACCICAMLPPSGVDFVVSLAAARDGFNSAGLPSGELSANSGLLLWSFIVQDSAAEAGAAKFLAPAFAFAIISLVVSLPFKNVFNRAIALALTMIAVFPAVSSGSPLLPQVYAALLLLRFLVAFALHRSRFNAAVCVLAAAAALSFDQHGPMQDSVTMPLALGLSAAMVVMCILLGGWKRKIVMTVIVAALCIPPFDFAWQKAKEFPLSWSIPALPELPIAVNSVNGRFAIFSFINSSIPEGGVVLTPYPGDISYYAEGRRPLALSSTEAKVLESQLPFYVCLPPESGNAVERAFRDKAMQRLGNTKSETLFEAEGWKILRISSL